MDRRRFLVGGAALGAASGLSWPAMAAATDDLRTAAREAWLYGLPLVEMASTRGKAIGRGGVNVFGHARTLSGPANRAVTMPNCDTLYSSAWLDLSAGPVTLTLPPTGERYFSVALMDMYTNNFAVLGQRTTGGDGGVFTVVGPREPAPFGAVRSPTPWVWALVRTLVSSDADLEAAHAIQDGLQIRARPGRTPPSGGGRDAAWNDYFLEVQQLIEENPPPASDTAFFHRIAPMQIGMREGFEQARFADPEVTDVQGGVADARALITGGHDGQKVEDGWVYPAADLGDFGQDYQRRAACALASLAALPPVEAMYMRAANPDGGFLFDGDATWRLRLPVPPPVDAFWSLTLYEATPDGQFFLSDNPLRRYAIGDRTPGLRRAPDGALEIRIGRGDPGGERTANWLPAPARGPYALVLRAYAPKQELLDGRYRLPPVENAAMAEAAPAAQPAEPARRQRRRRRRHHR